MRSQRVFTCIRAVAFSNRANQCDYAETQERVLNDY
jgi:hypothetical protein